MKIARFMGLALATGIAMAGVSGTALAATATVDSVAFGPPGPLPTATIYYGNSGDSDYLAKGLVGLGHFEIKGSYDPVGPAFDILSYCFDIRQDYDSPAGTVYTLTSLADALSDATKVSQINALISHGDTVVAGAGKQVGAVQLALWEILNESSANSYDVLSGVFRAEAFDVEGVDGADVALLANDYLGKVSNGTWLANPTYSFTVFQNADYQDQLTYTAGVPEPANWALLIGGFGMVGGALRRRRMVSAAIA